MRQRLAAEQLLSPGKSSSRVLLLSIIPPDSQGRTCPTLFLLVHLFPEAGERKTQVSELEGRGDGFLLHGSREGWSGSQGRMEITKLLREHIGRDPAKSRRGIKEFLSLKCGRGKGS